MQKEMERMAPTASTSNLNPKLSASVSVERTGAGVGISWAASAIQNSAPPVRIVGAASRYQGGYRLNI
jgi:hypothetical protein